MATTAKKALDGTVLDRLYKVIESRRGADPAVSNTARLFAKGTEKIAQKLGEEAVETVIEGVRGRKKDLALESADLLYHLLVLWADRSLKPDAVSGRPGGAKASPAWLPRRAARTTTEQMTTGPKGAATDELRSEQRLRQDPARRDPLQEGA
jgi:phosphoribosyl-ATP pyrophosphohydrolase